MDNDHTVSKYDRIRGQLEGVALFTRPSTIKNVETINRAKRNVRHRDL